MSFNITLTAAEWRIIYHPTEQYCKRSDGKNRFCVYSILKPNVWTPNIHTHFVEQTRLTCPIVYKRAKIYTGRNIYMDIIGHCPSYESNFKCLLNKEPESTDDRVIIHCLYIGTSNFVFPEERESRQENKKKTQSRLNKNNLLLSYVDIWPKIL